MNTEYIQFPVPKQFVPQVTALVARLMRDTAPGATPTSTTPTLRDANPRSASSDGRPAGTSYDGVIWSQTMFDRLREDKLLSQERVIKILDTVPIGKVAALPLEECAQLAGLNVDQFRHALGWLTKFTHKHPDLWTESTWPLGCQKGYDPGRPGVFYYWMSEDQACAWGR
jgi:hypothetical protein